MRKRTIVQFATGLMFLASALMTGCSGGGGGSSATNSENTNSGSTTVVAPITTPSADGNVQAAVGSVTINSPPVVTFALSDENGQPLDPATLVSNSANSIRFLIARLDDTGNYQNYIPAKDKNGALTGYPRYDGEQFDVTTGKATNKNAGTFATVKPGVYTYTFASDIKDSTKTYKNLTFDATKTHTVAIQIVRNITKNGKAFKQVANPFINFRPDGGATVPVRELVSISACNQCHGKLAVHGGSRIDIALCILCHNPGVAFTGSGVSVDFKTMIHKLHMGKNLPSQKLKQSGFFAEAKFASFSTVTLPIMSADSTGTPMDCVKCHQLGKDSLGRTYGAGVDKYKVATRANCSTCHDATAFAGEATLTVDGKSVTVPTTVTTSGGAHSGGPQADDSSCATQCHPTTGAEYGTSVTGAHTIWEKSTTNPGFKAKVVSVSNVGPLKTPVVTFQITDAAGKPVPLDTTNASSGAKQSIVLQIAIKPKGYADYINAPPYPNATPTDVTTTYGYELTPNQGRSIPVQIAGNNNGTSSGVSGITVPGAITESPVGSGRYVFTISTIANGSYSNRNNPSKLRPVLPPLDGEYKNGATVAFYIVASRTDVTVNRRNVAKNFTIQAAADEPVFYDLATGAVAATSENRRVVVDNAKCVKCHNYIPVHNGKDARYCVICHNSSNNDRNFATLIHKAHTGTAQAANKSADYAAFSKLTYTNNLLRCNACHIEDNPAPVSNGYPSYTTYNNYLNNRIPSAAQACVSCHDTTANAGVAVAHAQSKAAAFNYIPATATTAAIITDVVCTSCHSDTFRSLGHQLPF